MKNKNELYGIIGLGRFGTALAISLAKAGKEIVVVDNSEEKINEVASYADNAFLIEKLSKENLERIGLQNCDVVVVCIGEKIDVSILTTLSVIQLGVKRVISKAISEEHGSVLKTLGAEVVFPERDMAVRIAKKLLAPYVLEYISLSHDVDIMEIRLSEKIEGLTVEALDLRKKYGLNIIAVKSGGVINTDISPFTALNADDTLTVVGRKENIEKFEAYLC